MSFSSYDYYDYGGYEPDDDHRAIFIKIAIGWILIGICLWLFTTA